MKQHQRNQFVAAAKVIAQKCRLVDLMIRRKQALDQQDEEYFFNVGRRSALCSTLRVFGYTLRATRGDR